MKFSACAVVVLSLASIGCTSSQRPHRAQAVPNAPVAAAQDPLDSIARFEDMRSDGEGLVEALAARGEERTRVRAVRALGRLSREEYGAPVTDALAAALDDPSEDVRAAAAFALGMRGDPSTTGDLVAAADEGSPAVRALAIEALSRIDDPRARRAVIDAIGSSVPEVARAAVLGVQRFPREAPEAGNAESELVRVSSATTDVELQWRALSTLARRAVADARGEFERASSSTDPRVRIFAVQGLGSIPYAASSLATLHARLSDSDWRVACEAATALGKYANAASVTPLLAATLRTLPPHASHHIRRAAFDALGRVPAAAEAARTELSAARSDPAFEVRAAAIEAGARLYRDESAAALDSAARDENAVVRAGAAAGCAHVSAEIALPILERLLTDANLRVATTAAEALGEHAADPAARERVRAALGADDNGVRLAAALALAKVAVPDDLTALERALATTRGEIAPEVAAAVVDAAAHVGATAQAGVTAQGGATAQVGVTAQGGATAQAGVTAQGGANVQGTVERALAILKLAIANPDPYVSRKARTASLALRSDARLPRSPAAPRRSNTLPPTRSGANPRVAFETNRGVLVFELLPDEAPFHVENLLQLARRGHYDGTTFHRVVPDFVVQGGDLRGDGNGGTTWRSDAANVVALRGEFGPRPFRRGSLGMPRNDDPDSGGSQIFVTHRDTPHLDGRYTLFGELIEGFEVLDALQVGDVIERVRELPAEG